MITLAALATSLGRDISGVRRRAVKAGIPMHRAVNPGSNQKVLAVDAAGEKALRALYPTKLKPPPPPSDLEHAIHELVCARENVDLGLRVPLEGKNGEPSKADRPRYEALTKACVALDEVIGILEDIE